MIGHYTTRARTANPSLLFILFRFPLINIYWFSRRPLLSRLLVSQHFTVSTHSAHSHRCYLATMLPVIIKGGAGKVREIREGGGEEECLFSFVLREMPTYRK